ncbi:NADH-ubiquinone oxidoreductase-F iron-sulfur binding region domain-containing protein [Rhodoferax sp.]|uniref:NADH-ubiquinone oxidoreductase-F iron-sulfur binding region domain-containing protein n=1 Tax=Rhodoferax sp. TaxID=50421 RepID=UPI0026026C6C|nr:NADH-ubiquinone oxidoreductase-F iron-sulfur binding region domain-containing protein [Rhodoferax sp.]MDD3936449.1 NAD(P)H-dependent oxidoreductase subunit E [Rhodoferax sp.]
MKLAATSPSAQSLVKPARSREPIGQRARLKGRQSDAVSLNELRTLIGAPPTGGHRRDLLIEHLHQLNDAYGGLFERHLVALAQDMRLSMAEVYEVASFYHHFDIIKDGEQPARLTVRVCDGQSCAMAGADKLLARLPDLLGHAEVRVVRTPCVGRCAQAPVAVVHQHALAPATPEAVVKTVKLALSSTAADDQASQADANTTSTAAVTYADYRAQGGYALVQALAQGTLDASTVLHAMEDSGLRGLGGAGFPAGRKWRIVRGFAAPRLMAVNIDEGEPGTFKDRHYLERDPHRFLEGVLIAAQVVGVQACYLYLRDEYHDGRALLARELAALQADPPCALPHIELRRGAGAYVCGEESAMIESIEGKRGVPRKRPPYIAENGLFGRPTLEHNFETLYWVRDIVEKGPQWFNGFGRHGRHGLRSFSVSGRVNEPGVKLAPAGITLQELIDEHCGGMQDGHSLYAYLPGGASGGILPARLANLPLDFDTLQAHGCFIGSAAVVVLSQHDRARDAALNAMRFFADESCGQCTPCRVGTAKAARLMEVDSWDQATLNDLCQVMADASICGLGQAAPNPVRCVQTYFAHEIGDAA